MFDVQTSMLGVPANVFMAAVGSVGLVVGFFWIRRITQGDSEPQSFLATADRDSGPAWIAIFGLALLGFVVILSAVYLKVLMTRRGSFLDQVIVGGAVLSGLAVVLAIRRLWYRFRSP